MNTDRWNRINELFLAVADLPAEDRSAYLETACRDDDPLRAEVERLLASDCQEDESFLAPVTEFPGLNPPAADADDPLIGRRFSHYEVRSLLGAGGMGRVYLGVRFVDYSQQVAIKFLQRDFGSDELQRRFQNEMQFLAELGFHANIAALLDAGVTDDDRPYLVMEYVDGLEVDQYCDRQTLSIESRLRLFLGVCEAVQFAHQHTVIHRDLKPSNILVPEDGAPKLIDFGIAKLLSSDATQVSDDLTKTAHRALTPHYASPEHVQGLPLTTASDVYSLGVVLYELFTGRRPYRLSNKSAAEVERVVCEHEPVRPSTVVGKTEFVQSADGSKVELTPELLAQRFAQRPDRLQRQLAGDLDNIVLMALRKEPQRRYQSAHHLAEDIRRHLEGLPVTAHRATWRYRTSKFIRRNKVGVIAAVLVLASLVGGILGTTTQWFRAEAEARLARRASQEAERAAMQSQQNEQLALQQVYRANIALAAAAMDRGDALAARYRLDACPVELRHWEWRYFDRRLQAGRTILSGHEDRVSQGVFFKNGTRLATGSWDGTVRIWDVAAGREISVLRDDMAPIGNLVGSADGQFLATASHDGVLRIWNAHNETLQTRIDTLYSQIALSPDAQLLASASREDRKVRLWNATNGELHSVLPDSPSTTPRVKLSPDGTRLAHSCDRGVILWDLAANEQLAELPGVDGIEDPLAFSPDSKRVVTAGRTPEVHVQLWNASDGQWIAGLTKHSAAVRHASFNADGTLLATASVDRMVRLFHGETGQQISVLHGHQAPAVWTAFAPNGAFLASCSDDQTIRLWDCENGRPIRVLAEHTSFVHSIQVSPDSRAIASCSADRTVRIWDVATTEPGVFRGHEGFVMAVAFGPGDATFASGSLDGSVRLWDVATGEQLQEFRNEKLPTEPTHPASRALAVEFSADGSLVAAVRGDGSLEVWDVKTALCRGRVAAEETAKRSIGFRAELVFTPDSSCVIYQRADGRLISWNIDEDRETTFCQLPPKSVQSIALSADGTRLALGLTDRTARIWQVDPPRELIRCEHGATVNTVAFNHEGGLLASGGVDRHVRVWSTIDAKQVAELQHSAVVYALAFTPDGGRLATGTAKAPIQLWDTRTWAAVAQLSGHNRDVNALEFAADGARLLSGSSDRTVRIWNASP